MTFMLQPEVNGRKIGFETGPKGVLSDRSSLVLIHGAGGSRESWRFQIGALDDRINVLALELPGHGETEGPALERTSEMADFFAEVLKTWNLPGPVVVGGHSMGGAVCLELVLRHPGLARGMILAGTGAKLGVNPALFEGLKSDFLGTVRLIVKWTLAKTASQALVDESQVLLNAAGRELLIKDFTACDKYNVTDDLGRIHVPVLVTGGAEDKMTPPDLSKYLADNIKDARLVIIEQAGHTLVCEQPDEFNRAVFDFMSGLN